MPPSTLSGSTLKAPVIPGANSLMLVPAAQAMPNETEEGAVIKKERKKRVKKISASDPSDTGRKRFIG
jgi:hypothetical protein